MDGFIALKFLTQLMTPPGLLVAGLLAGGALALVGFRRLGLLGAVAGVAQAVVFSLSPVGDALLRPLEDEARAAAATAPACCYDFIIVLGAGIVMAAPPWRPDPELTDSSDRLWQASRLFHRGLAPGIVVTGGSYAGRRGGPTQTEAEAMKVLLVDLGVPADRIVLEGRALNTIDNMREVRALVGDKRVALVTSAHHMPRALQLARLAGLNVEAFPCDWRIVPSARPEWEKFLPSIEAMWNASIALREYVALIFDRRARSLSQ